MAVIDPANLIWRLSGGAGNTDPNASLGGAMSATALGTGLDNLFDLVDGVEALSGDVEYRCLYLLNTDPNISGLYNGLLWLSALPAQVTLDIGFDPAGKGGEATTVATEEDPPAGVSFSRPTSEGAALALPDGPYLNGEYVALWLRRTVPAGAMASALDEAVLSVAGDSTA